MKKLWKFFIAAMAVIIAGVLFLVYTYGPNYNFYLFPPSPEKYGQYAIERMDREGLYTQSKEWADTKEEVLKEIKKADSYEEVLPLLEKAIGVAGGKHSFIMTENELEESNNENIFPTSEEKEGVLYVKLPAFSGMLNKDEAQKYVDILSQVINKKTYHGIIIDLQENTGGDMHPMITGISNLIPDGRQFSFIDKQDSKTDINLENGRLADESDSVKNEKTEKIKTIPIAVLINEMTASSGEMTALCFKGLDNVQFFGKNSAAYTTVNTSIPLYDGTYLQLTTAKIEDRTGKIYQNDSIVPDVETENARSEAEKWLTAS
ncbi:S41 family peptidase [Isobaculum melis]|uniref:Peptidase family S41 n=1 Tax=Isobaculum melis TaxID=142588 RepID=A0A1H9PRS9_9LACT|nr:S41 family peptidase [Isobaculum melis]SER50924.1 Peptidase family S41 [Isobaculum melis]